jgi:hypothetical protein
MVAVVGLSTLEVVTANEPVDCPPETATDVGTVAAVLLLLSETEVPPVPARPPRVTTPAEPVPPVTVEGLTLTEISGAGVTVSDAVWSKPGVAVMSAVMLVLTGMVLTANVAVVWPAAIVTVAGTVAAAESLLKVTTTPPVGAA